MYWCLSTKHSLRRFDGIWTSWFFNRLKHFNEKQEGQPAHCTLPSMYLSVNSVVIYTMLRSTFSHFSVAAHLYEAPKCSRPVSMYLWCDYRVTLLPTVACAHFQHISAVLLPLCQLRPPLECVMALYTVVLCTEEAVCHCIQPVFEMAFAVVQ